MTSIAAALDLGDSLIPDLVGSDFRRRVAKHERADAIRALTIKLLRDQASDGQSDDRGSPDADNFKKSREIARVVSHVVLVRAGFGEPVAALVVSDDAEIRRKDLRNFGPDAEIAAEGIDEDERLAIARALIEVMDRPGRWP